MYAPVSFNSSFSTAERAGIETGAAGFGFPIQQAPVQGIAVFRANLAQNFNPAPLPAPAPATRTFVITSRLLPNDSELVRYEASRYGVTPEIYLYWGGMAVGILWAYFHP